MTQTFTVQNILDDIEIELIQGAVAHDDLGRAIQAVRKFQNKLRGELLDPGTRADYTTLATRQFQLNDLLLTLVQTMAANQQALRAELLRALQRGLPEASAAPSTPATIGAGGTVQHAERAWAEAIGEIEAAMAPDALDLAIAIQDEGQGPMAALTRPVRGNFHSLSVYYANQLAARQAAINRLYGDRLLALHEHLEAQHAMITALQAQLAQSES